ncbi:hypothetical protein [Lysinibacillus sp. 54212]|uniref:hypothetical protein n=1 Tax=Lysinibacillus sp. 54212 TaxID=3119829 RepID=UPI002FCB2EE0
MEKGVIAEICHIDIHHLIPIIGKHVQINKSSDGAILEIDYHEITAAPGDFEYVDLNQTAYEVCMQMNGIYTVDEILKMQCNRYGESVKDHEDWYYEMIESFILKGIIFLTKKRRYYC